MVVEGDAKKMVAKRVLKAGPYTAKPMAVVEGANTSAAQRALKGVLITALHMVVAVVA